MHLPRTYKTANQCQHVVISTSAKQRLFSGGYAGQFGKISIKTDGRWTESEMIICMVGLGRSPRLETPRPTPSRDEVLLYQGR